MRFTVDVRLAGMLHAAVLRSPVAHGRVQALDLEAARAVPGVRAVIGPDTELSLTTRAPLLAAEPGYAGQPIAVVAADTLEVARAGVARSRSSSRCSVTWSIPQEAVNEQQFTAEPSDDARGDADAELAAAEVTVELALETPAQVQTPLEPHGAVASWDGDRLTAWVSTQGMFAARDELSKAFGLRTDDVRVRTEYVGGGLRRQAGSGLRGARRRRAGPAHRAGPCGWSTTATPSSSTVAAGPRPARRSGSAPAETGRSPRSTPMP